MNGTPGYPLSGANGMCVAFDAEHAAARKRVVQLAPIGSDVQGIGVPVGTTDQQNVPTTVSASSSERSPG